MVRDSRISQPSTVGLTISVCPMHMVPLEGTHLNLGRCLHTKGEIITVDGCKNHFAPPKKPHNDEFNVNTNQQKFQQRVEFGAISGFRNHPQYHQPFRTIRHFRPDLTKAHFPPPPPPSDTGSIPSVPRTSRKESSNVDPGLINQPNMFFFFFSLVLVGICRSLRGKPVYWGSSSHIGVLFPGFSGDSDHFWRGTPPKFLNRGVLIRVQHYLKQPYMRDLGDQWASGRGPFSDLLKVANLRVKLGNYHSTRATVCVFLSACLSIPQPEPASNNTTSSPKGMSINVGPTSDKQVSSNKVLGCSAK